jgi:hypothetical protein
MCYIAYFYGFLGGHLVDTYLVEELDSCGTNMWQSLKGKCPTYSGYLKRANSPQCSQLK